MASGNGQAKLYAVVRLRGEPRVKGDITDTLRMLRLQKVNHCALVPGGMLGMVHKTKDHVAYGPVDAATVEALLRSRGRVTGQRKLTDEWVNKHTGFGDIGRLATALASGEITLNKIEGLQPLFRLHPARKGLPGRGSKDQVQKGGAVGNWGEKISELLERMR
ncbi:MAG: 50S ribosomal protein L30 [Halobacteria archaeon]